MLCHSRVASSREGDGAGRPPGEVPRRRVASVRRSALSANGVPSLSVPAACTTWRRRAPARLSRSSSTRRRCSPAVSRTMRFRPPPQASGWRVLRYRAPEALEITSSSWRAGAHSRRASTSFLEVSSSSVNVDKEVRKLDTVRPLRDPRHHQSVVFAAPPCCSPGQDAARDHRLRHPRHGPEHPRYIMRRCSAPPVLITTDLLARDDVQQVSLVISFGLHSRATSAWSLRPFVVRVSSSTSSPRTTRLLQDVQRPADRHRGAPLHVADLI